MVDSKVRIIPHLQYTHIDLPAETQACFGSRTPKK
jgi:hypothetical protein